jgi:uncharacterized protein YdaT
MPKVKMFTATQNKKRDRQAKGLIRHGYTESRAYAIATANVKRSKRKRKK